jgi:adenine deaminase
MPTGTCQVNVMKMNGVMMDHVVLTREASVSWADFVAQHGLCYVTVIERHGKNGSVSHGLLQGFNLKSGSIASSFGHDAHNLLIVGTHEADMALALKTVVDVQGGVVMAEDGKVLAQVELPVCGLLSDKRAPEIKAEMEKLKVVWESKKLALPYFGFNLIELSVIPDLRLTDQGLVLVREMKIIPLFEDIPAAA